VVDANLLFTYISSGSPGNVGDAALFNRSILKREIDRGMLRTLMFELPVIGATHHVFPYLVGDAAFGMGQHVIKVVEPANDPASKAMNRRVINSRRGSEIAFQRLKGRWTFCTRNKFYGDPSLVSKMVDVCCGLHNFVQGRDVEMPTDIADVLAYPLPAAAAAPRGNYLRECDAHGL
jgi:hypothetical protein